MTQVPPCSSTCRKAANSAGARSSLRRPARWRWRGFESRPMATFQGESVKALVAFAPSISRSTSPGSAASPHHRTRVACRNNVSPAAAPRRAGGGRGHPRHRAAGLAGCRGARRRGPFRAHGGRTRQARGGWSAPSRGSPSAALTCPGDRRHRSQVSEPVGGASSSASARFSAPRRSRPSIHESRWERSRSTRASAIDTL